MTTPAPGYTGEDDEGEEEMTQLVDADFPRVDLVGRPANGIPRFLIAKAAGGPGLMHPDMVRDLISKSGTPEIGTGDTVTLTGTPGAIAKLVLDAPQVAVARARAGNIRPALLSTDDKKQNLPAELPQPAAAVRQQALAPRRVTGAELQSIVGGAVAKAAGRCQPGPAPRGQAAACEALQREVLGVAERIGAAQSAIRKREDERAAVAAMRSAWKDSDAWLQAHGAMLMNSAAIEKLAEIRTAGPRPETWRRR
jgi:hypothetical protein